ncbi:TniQ family protein [Aurantimonas coralicida]|uniref:TniQ family protein n=1 Tax=Aurantimonas coralicida TaxID=182270 RepID=UPI001E4C9EB7|nr:TniQ family protein [Aurantimonas coralicida]MCD1642397.1 TniQ family protein [Aurantimonas coralicida]
MIDASELPPISPLGFRHALQCREPAIGFASRLAMLNRRPLARLFGDMLIDGRRVAGGDDAEIRKLAILGSADPDALLAWSPVSFNEDWELGGEDLGRRGAARGFFSFCPHCVLEDLDRFTGPDAARTWLRVEWIVPVFRSCAKHHVALRRVDWEVTRYGPTDFCARLEPILGNMEKLARDAVEVEAGSPFEAWLLARLGGTRSGSWLDQMPLYAGAAYCRAVGLSAVKGPKPKITKIGPAEWVQIEAEGFRILSKGPDALRELLGRLVKAQEGTRGYWGLNDTYGEAFDWLRRNVTDAAYRPATEIVRDHAMQSIPLRSGTRVLGELVETQRVHTLRSLKEETGFHHKTLRKIVERQGGPSRQEIAGRRDNRVIVSGQAPLIIPTGPMIVPREVEDQYGIPRLHLKEIILKGHLRSITASNGIYKARHRFLVSDVKAMMDRLFAGAVDVESPREREADIQRARAMAFCSVSEILALLFEDKLAWKGRRVGVDGYSGLLVNADEVLEQMPRRPERTGLTSGEVWRMIPGMKDKSMPKFIKAGYFDIIHEQDPETRRTLPMITRESVDRFREKYVSLGELCEKEGAHHATIRQRMDDAGITPVFGMREFGSVFYLRISH